MGPIRKPATGGSRVPEGVGPVTRRGPRVTTRWALLLIWTFGPQAFAHPLPLKDVPVPGWPKLQIETHYVARIAMRGYCFPVQAGTPIPDTFLDSCARPDFWRGVCYIFIDAEYLGTPSLREHEERRCRGYDQRDSDLLAEALRVWRERGENRYADMVDFEVMMFILEPPSKLQSCVDLKGPDRRQVAISCH